jgi:hypothetical protein
MENFIYSARKSEGEASTAGEQLVRNILFDWDGHREVR